MTPYHSDLMGRNKPASHYKGKSKTWVDVPENCQVCKGVYPYGLAVDGKTQEGPWAFMCVNCFSDHGVGLGVGKGQAYVHNPQTLQWEKRHAS